MRIKKTALICLHLMAFSGPYLAHGAILPAIKEAREKLADRNRSEAITILLTAIKKEWTAGRRDELEAELKKTTEIFLTNEGQRLFELAESARHGGKPGFVAHYEEALKAEPQNAKVIAGYVLALMATKKCRAANDPLTQFEAVNPYSEEYKLLKFKYQVCSEPTAITLAQEIELEGNRDFAVIKKTARAQAEFAKAHYDLALNLARAAAKSDDRFASPYFWAWKVLARDGQGLDEAQRYLSLCKNISPETRRKYSYDPELCGNTEEVEEFLRDEESGKHVQ